MGTAREPLQSARQVTIGVARVGPMLVKQEKNGAPTNDILDSRFDGQAKEKQENLLQNSVLV